MKVKIIQLFLIGLILISFNSCIVHDVEQPKKQYVNIFSDFLTKKDLPIFKSFEKENHIKVRIQHFDSEDLINKIVQEGYDCEADVILFHSIFYTNKLLKKNKFQPFKSEIIEENIHYDFKDSKNYWISFGINPYLFTADNDTIFDHYNLNQIVRNKQIENYSNENLAVLYAQYYRTKFNLDKSEEIIAKKLLINKKSDSLSISIRLRNYNDYSKDSAKMNIQFFPSHEACYYNLYTASVLKQAKNFKNAVKFIEYIVTPKYNEQINEYLGTIPMDLTRLKNSYKYYKEPLVLFPIPFSKILPKLDYYEQLIKKYKTETSL